MESVALKLCCWVSGISVAGEEGMTGLFWRLRVIGVRDLSTVPRSWSKVRIGLAGEATRRVSLRLFEEPSLQSSEGCVELLCLRVYIRKGTLSFRRHFRSLQRAIKSSPTSAAFLCTKSA